MICSLSSLRQISAFVAIVFLSLPLSVANDDVGRFQTEIRPLLEKFCLDCHSTEEQEGELDLESFDTLEAGRRQRKWSMLSERIW